MIEKFKYIWVVILLIMLFAPADAAFRLYGTITRPVGTTITPVSAGLVEIIRVTGTPIGTSGDGTTGDSPFIVNGSNYLNDRTVNTRLTEATGAIKSDGWLIGSTGTENVIVRAWYNRTLITQIPDSSMYYAYSSQFPLGDAMSAPRPLTTDISAIYRASAPAPSLAPTIRVWYTDTFSPRFDVTSIRNAATYNAEVVRTLAGEAGAPYVFTVAGGGLTTPRPYYSDTATMTITDLPVGSYTVFSQERNWFGLSTPGATQPFELRASAAGGGAVTINIRRKQSLLLGINSFSVPNRTFSITSVVNNITGAHPVLADPSVATPLDLINKINAIHGATGPIVRTFGTWNEADQTEKGVVINYDTATSTGITTASQSEINRLFPTFETGRGYQTYVKPFTDADINLSLTLQ
jgi:hypothetical protein